MASWWVLVLGLCVGIPRGASIARSAPPRPFALGGVVATALLLAGGATATESPLLVLGVTVPLWLVLAVMITPRLQGHRLVGVAVFAAPIMVAGGVLPFLVGPGATELSPILDLRSGYTTIMTSSGPTVLLCGAAALIGVVVELISLLRTSVSVSTVRAAAGLTGGLALLLVATAGALASGTIHGIASRVGVLGVLLGAAGTLSIRHGVRGLDWSGEITRAIGVFACFATGAVFAGTALLPAGAMTWIAFIVLFALAAALGAVGGLCGAAVLVRSRREPTSRGIMTMLRAVHGRVHRTLRSGPRAPATHP